MAQRWATLLMIITIAAAASSCGGGNASTQGNGNTTQASGLTLNSSSLDFGTVAVGSSKTSSISVTNSSAPGGSSVVISQISISGAGFTASAPSVPLTVMAGQSTNISISFAPSAGGVSNGSISFTIQGGSPISVPLTGTGLASGQLSAQPSSIAFGTVPIGSPQSLNGTLTAGASDITVSSASWNGQGFSVSAITFPATIKAGSSTTYTVSFDPQAAGAVSGQISFASDATNSATTVSLSGTGAQPVQHSVNLSWNASMSQIVGYYVYRSSTSGSYGAPLNGTPQTALTFTDSNVQSGATYYYVVTAVDSSAHQSVHSNEAVALIP